MMLLNHLKIGIKGFSLLEFIITIAIFTILITIAYPSYEHLVIKSRRIDALTALIQYKIMIEQCFAQNGSYSKPCLSLPPFPQASAHGFYNINFAELNTKDYTLQAIPTGSQAKDTLCAILTINQSNVKLAMDSSGNPSPNCWNPI